MVALSRRVRRGDPFLQPWRELQIAHRAPQPCSSDGCERDPGRDRDRGGGSPLPSRTQHPHDGPLPGGISVGALARS
eukprot:5528016-Alexandrium_andersonii.AAC.1